MPKGRGILINDQESYEVSASARRVTLTDSEGGLIGTANKLPVEASLEVGDIEIGAVEIKDHTTNVRVSVEQDITKNAQFVQSESLKKELETINSLVPSKYDFIDLGYTGDNLTTVIFKIGGSGGTIVSTLTLAYAGNNLTSVTKT